MCKLDIGIFRRKKRRHGNERERVKPKRKEELKSGCVKERKKEN